MGNAPFKIRVGVSTAPGRTDRRCRYRDNGHFGWRSLFGAGDGYQAGLKAVSDTLGWRAGFSLLKAALRTAPLARIVHKHLSGRLGIRWNPGVGLGTTLD